MSVSSDPDSPKRSTAQAIAVGMGVSVGILASAGLCFLWLLFGGASLGNSGATSESRSTFLWTSLAVFGTYMLVTFVLFFMRRHVSALLVAWLPLILVFVVAPMVAVVAEFF